MAAILDRNAKKRIIARYHHVNGRCQVNIQAVLQGLRDARLRLGLVLELGLGLGLALGLALGLRLRLWLG